MIDNFLRGQAFLQEEFGVTPRIAWQLDPFGHSVGMAHLFQLMGFEAVFMARVDTSLHAAWESSQELQFIWRPSFAGSEPLDGIFCHVLDKGLYRTHDDIIVPNANE